MKLLVLVSAVIVYRVVSGLSTDYVELLRELPEFLDDTLEQVIKTSFAEHSSYGALLRNVRSADLECTNRLDDRSCRYFVNNGFCNLRRESMEIYCKRECKICVDPPCGISKYGCCLDNTTLARGPNMLGCDDDCKDLIGKSRCEVLKSEGNCYKNHEKAMRECAVTCGYCRPCEDEDPIGCGLAVKYNGCNLNKGQMANICRKSCNFCGRRDPCFEFSCPRGSVCLVAKDMKPYCQCHGNCHSGDLYTGVLCGRDGKEYKNLCELKKINCGHPELKHITVKDYGRCQSKAITSSDKRTLCTKREPAMCKIWEAKGYCKTRPQVMRGMCPQACNVCAAQSSKPACHYSKHGCCLDKKTPCKGTDYKGCPRYPRCRDFSKVFCKRFVPVCGSEQHKGKMSRFCPKSCEMCH